ncbi:MAG: hypothetical protein OXN89_07735 [Bryobacterales bacterium]|nr:hypothetical protein [Bryobacterales bacterium]
MNELGRLRIQGLEVSVPKRETEAFLAWHQSRDSVTLQLLAAVEGRVRAAGDPSRIPHYDTGSGSE